MNKRKPVITTLLFTFFLLFATACTDLGDTAPVTWPSTDSQTTDTFLTYEDALAAEYVYTGEPFVEVHDNLPFFDDKQSTTAFEEYAPLDSLGRCGAAYANVCMEIMPTQERGAIGSVKPSGWQSVKYSGIVDGGYLYNRCHLIAYVLSAENANAQNLITGTRYLNIEGMLPFETKVANYVKDTDNHVLYRVTPVFSGDNLLADGVLMEGYSVEDKGSGICFCIFAFNVQPGIGIDYQTGESWIASDADTQAPSGGSAQDYVVNTNSKKFHLPSCPNVKSIKDKNKETLHETRSQMIENGYEPCGNCKP